MLNSSLAIGINGIKNINFKDLIFSMMLANDIKNGNLTHDQVKKIVKNKLEMEKSKNGKQTTNN